MDKLNFKLGNEVKRAKKNNLPIVALETTIVSHGMPYPQNIETALNAEKIIKKEGATPATIGIVNGIITVGMSEEEIHYFGKEKNIIKVSRRDIPIVVAEKKNGATTVAGTMIISDLAGIKVMATGGIGGVHRDANDTFDISADLQELGNSRLAVICSGPKSILDINLTLEYLETMGVPVIGYKTNFLPNFYSSESEFKVDYRFDKVTEIANIMKNKDELSLKGSILICNPVPKKYSIPNNIIEKAINSSMLKARQNKIHGKKLTPFLLEKVSSITKGKTLETNIQLMLNNAKLAARIAFALNK